MPSVPFLDPKPRRDDFGSKIYRIVSGFVMDSKITYLKEVSKISQNI